MDWCTVDSQARPLYDPSSGEAWLLMRAWLAKVRQAPCDDAVGATVNAAVAFTSVA